MSIRVSSNWKTVADKWATIEMQPLLCAWANEVGPLIKIRLQVTAPRRSGKFAGSIRYRLITAGPGFELEFFSNVSYAEYVIEDTVSHLITPKNTQALWWSGAKHPVHSAMHPAHAGNRFAAKIALEVTQPAQDILARMLSEALSA